MEGTKELITTDAIRSKVYILRGQQVMLDQDLAEIYGYQVKNLNQQVKRNLTRFPEDFMFQLTKEEVELVKSQFVTSRNINYFEGQEGGRRKLPYAQMNEAEKREFLSQLVDNVQIYEERKENGQWLKSIEFRLPIIEKEFPLSLDNDTQNETVCFLTRIK